MGGTKRKIRLDQKLEKHSAIKTTFTKRRKTLFENSQELCHALPQSQVSVAIIVFSPAGNPYVFGYGVYPYDHPDFLFDSFLRDCASAPHTVRPPLPSSCSVGGGCGSGSTPFVAPTHTQEKEETSAEKIRAEDLDWLSLKDCDSLDNMIAKRDLLLRMSEVIEQSLLSSPSSSSAITTATATATAMPQELEPLTTITATDLHLLTSEFEGHPHVGQEVESSSLDVGGGWSTLIQGTTAGGPCHHVEGDNHDADYDMWDRLMIFKDDDVYLNIDSLLCC